jgi:hypothetical protein
LCSILNPCDGDGDDVVVAAAAAAADACTPHQIAQTLTPG